MRTIRQRAKSRDKERKRRAAVRAEKKANRPIAEKYKCLRCNCIFGSTCGPEVFCLPCRTVLASMETPTPKRSTER